MKTDVVAWAIRVFVSLFFIVLIVGWVTRTDPVVLLLTVLFFGLLLVAAAVTAWTIWDVARWLLAMLPKNRGGAA